MKGDILIIKDHHRKCGIAVVDALLDGIRTSAGCFIITVAGESGAGKSELAAAIAEGLDENNISSFIFQQDDFFIYPPKTNAEKRVKDIRWVGTGEVKLALIDEILLALKNGVDLIEKPLVIFDEDRITEEQVSLENIRVIIVEGTYTSLLQNADCRVFIDRDLHDTRESRKERSREEQNDYLEKILWIEHDIIARHKPMADLIVDKNFSLTKPRKT